MPRVKTACGGEQPTHVYANLRSRFAELFEGLHSLEINPATVAADGVYWQVAAGIINAPYRALNGSAMTVRRVVREDGNWYEAEVITPRGRLLGQYGYGTEGAYRMYPDGGLDVIDEAVYSSMLGILDNTQFTPEASEAAALQMLDRIAEHQS